MDPNARVALEGDEARSDAAGCRVLNVRVEARGSLIGGLARRIRRPKDDGRCCVLVASSGGFFEGGHQSM